MQYVFTLQDYHQVSVRIKILRKIWILMTFFKNLIHPRKECGLILTVNFVVTYILSKYFYNYWCPMMALSSQNMLCMWYWIVANLSWDWWFLYSLLYIMCYNRLYRLQLIQNSIKQANYIKKLKLVCLCGHTCTCWTQRSMHNFPF